MGSSSRQAPSRRPWKRMPGGGYTWTVCCGGNGAVVMK
eukprot:CAMPEP_0172909554 /NCGR_PEP_ID=MMETSP1075-20121228/182907_1 /TAXON_ID=2916 /ORGANISM="Ceratium fusus, Strain PA161109" /LENGTH=37 /DNA_ID= /DNA_START= /DNA_END= /DNA_ORIENTATION=